MHLGEKKKTENTKVSTLDDFIIENKILKVDFIKLDVDGYEYFVLKGGEKFLKKNRPPIFMELAPYLYKENGYNENDIMDLILSFGYKFFNLRNNSKIDNIYDEIRNIPNGSSKNILII